MQKGRHSAEQKQAADWLSLQEGRETHFGVHSARKQSCFRQKKKKKKGFNCFLLQLAKASSKKIKVQISHDCSWICNKESLWSLPICRLKKKQWDFSQWFWPQADTSVPKLWAPQGGRPGIAPAPVFPQASPSCEYQVAATVQQAAGDVSGHPWAQLHLHSGTPGTSAWRLQGWEDSFGARSPGHLQSLHPGSLVEPGPRAVLSGCLLGPQPSSHLVVTLFHHSGLLHLFASLDTLQFPS